MKYLGTIKWEYVDFIDGKLYDEDGNIFLNEIFKDENDAEGYLFANSIRASIR